MEAQHGITCECGQTFQNPETLEKHITEQKTLKEIQRIGGPKFYNQYQAFEKHTPDLKDMAQNHTIQFTPENATKIAKQAVKQLVDRHDEYNLPDTDTHSTDRQRKQFQIACRYRDRNGGIDENQLYDDLSQYQIEDIQPVITEFLRRLEEIPTNHGKKEAAEG